MRQGRARYAEEGHTHAGGGGGGSLPSTSGHSVGEVLRLGAGLVADWAAILGLIPSGGSTGQVLKKNSGTDYDVSWSTPAAVPAVLDDLTDVSAASPTTGYVLEWNGTAWVPAAPSGGGGGWTWRGTWNSGTAYVAGDVVKRSLGLYIATGSSTGSDPAAPPTTPHTESVTDTAGSPSAFDRAIGQEFVLSADLDVTSVDVLVATGDYLTTSDSVYIKSGSVSGTTVSSGTINSTVSGSGTATANMSAAHLTAGVSYWLVVYTPAHYGAGYTSGYTLSGGLTTPTGLRNATSPGGSWAGPYSSARVPFNLNGTVPATSAWDLMVQGV